MIDVVKTSPSAILDLEVCRRVCRVQVLHDEGGVIEEVIHLLISFTCGRPGVDRQRVVSQRLAVRSRSDPAGSTCACGVTTACSGVRSPTCAFSEALLELCTAPLISPMLALSAAVSWRRASTCLRSLSRSCWTSSRSAASCVVARLVGGQLRAHRLVLRLSGVQLRLRGRESVRRLLEPGIGVRVLSERLLQVLLGDPELMLGIRQKRRLLLLLAAEAHQLRLRHAVLPGEVGRLLIEKHERADRDEDGHEGVEEGPPSLDAIRIRRPVEQAGRFQLRSSRFGRNGPMV